WESLGYCIAVFSENACLFYQDCCWSQRPFCSSGDMPAMREGLEGGYWGDLLRLQDGHVGKIRGVCGDDDVTLRNHFGSLELDVYFLVLLRFDRNQFLQTVAVAALALNRYIILSGGDFGDRDALGAVGCKNLIDDAGAGVVVLVEND